MTDPDTLSIGVITGAALIVAGTPHRVQGGVVIAPFDAMVNGMNCWIDKTGPWPFGCVYVATRQLYVPGGRLVVMLQTVPADVVEQAVDEGVRFANVVSAICCPVELEYKKTFSDCVFGEK